MNRGKIIKIIGLNLVMICLNVILFSPGFIGLEIGGESILQTALSITIIIMSIVIFVLGNYRLLSEKKTISKSTKIESRMDCIAELKENKHKKTFTKDINALLEQIQRLSKKKEMVNELLSEKFSETEMSYAKFQGVIKEIEKLFYINIKSVINKVSIFDQEDYDLMRKDYESSRLSEDIIIEKMNIYNEYISFVKESVEDNEEILLKLDKLLLELSKFNSLEDGELENMAAMKEIDDLISKTKFYK